MSQVEIRKSFSFVAIRCQAVENVNYFVQWLAAVASLSTVWRRWLPGVWRRWLPGVWCDVIFAARVRWGSGAFLSGVQRTWDPA